MPTTRRPGSDVRTDLGGLNLSTVPKVFIECGNMRNARDAQLMDDPAFQQRIADALAQQDSTSSSLIDERGLAWKTPDASDRGSRCGHAQVNGL